MNLPSLPIVEQISSIWNSFVPNNDHQTPNCSLVLAIDFGTSNSSVALWRHDKARVKIIKNTRGEKTTPTQLLFAPHFENFFAGDISGFPDDVLLKYDGTKDIKSNSLPKPHVDGENTKGLNEHITKRRVVSGLKNLLGMNSIPEIKERYPNFPYQLETVPSDESPDGQQVMVVCEDTLGHVRKYSVIELVSLFLSYLRECAVDYLKRKPIKSSLSGHVEDPTYLNRVVLGIPAHFPEKKKDALKEAAFMAGFDEIHFMIESTAAAMAYGLLVAGKKKAMVFDMGGGTTDISILDIDDGKHNIIYTGGHSKLGGQDFDQHLLSIIEEKLIFALKRKGTEITLDDLNSNSAKRILLMESKVCKETLSRETFSEIHLSQSHFESMNLKIKLKPNESMKLVVNRDEFVHAVKPLLMLVQDTVEMAIQAIQQKQVSIENEKAINDVNVSPEDVLDEIVIVGGSSQIPAIQDAIRIACEKNDIYTFSKVDKRTKLQRVPRAFCTSVSPEYAVVEGLSLRGAIIAGENTHALKNMLMMDCLPTSIGIISHENGCKIFEPILPQGSRIPCSVSKIFQVANNYQRFVSLEIYEEIEESQLVASNNRDTTSSTSSSSKDSFRCERKYAYHLLVTADVPIYNHQLDTLSFQDQKEFGVKRKHRYAEVTFKVNEDGQLSYDVSEVHNFDPPSFENDENNQAIHSLPYNDGSTLTSKVTYSTTMQSWVLIAFSVVLLLLYITLKILFPPPVNTMESGIGSMTHEESSFMDSISNNTIISSLGDTTLEMEL